MANRRDVIRSLGRVALVTFALAATLAACGKTHLSGGPYEGLVRDKATGQPVADALVLVRWMGTTPSMHSSAPLCYYHEVVKTGPDGRFVVKPWRVSTGTGGRDPTWLPHIDPLRVEELVFKPGYRDRFVKGGKRDPMKIVLEPFQSQPNDQISFLSELRYQGGCDGHSAMVELPWRQALAAEASAVANGRGSELSEWSRKLVGSIQFSLDELQHGQVEAQRRRIEGGKETTK